MRILKFGAIFSAIQMKSMRVPCIPESKVCRTIQKISEQDLLAHHSTEMQIPRFAAITNSIHVQSMRERFQKPKSEIPMR
jgi:hypothetical protein